VQASVSVTFPLASGFFGKSTGPDPTPPYTQFDFQITNQTAHLYGAAPVIRKDYPLGR